MNGQKSRHSSYGTLGQLREARVAAIGHARLRGARERAAGTARSAAQNLRWRTLSFVEEPAAGDGLRAHDRHVIATFRSAHCHC
jgi:hypothetical protein